MIIHRELDSAFKPELPEKAQSQAYLKMLDAGFLTHPPLGEEYSF
ncbi:MAG: hypothetical protein ACFE95_00890 [Candidatus Hodarchaeota archaeon]